MREGRCLEQSTNFVYDDLYTSLIFYRFLRNIQLQDLIGWKTGEPFLQKRIEKRGIFCAGDIDPVTCG